MTDLRGLKACMGTFYASLCLA